MPDTFYYNEPTRAQARKLRGTANRAKGIRFERAIARKFRAAGFEVRRNLEYDGFQTGTDLILSHNGKRLPIATQCKSVNKPDAWRKGLYEAQKGAFWARDVCCIHSYKGKIMGYDCMGKSFSLPELIQMLKDIYLS